MSLKTENWKLLIPSIFYMISSILSYTTEKEEFLNFFQTAGVVIVLVGSSQILIYFFKKEYMKPNEISFFFGVLYYITGLIVATKPYLIVDSHPIAISVLTILDTALRLQYSVNLFRLGDTQRKIHLTLAIVPLLMGMVLTLIPFEEKALHNLFSFLLILGAIASFCTILYYRGVTRRYDRHSEQILDTFNQEVTAHEVIDGKDDMM